MARDTGLSRESLSKEGNPSFATILKVAGAIGVRLHAEPIKKIGLVGDHHQRYTA